MPGNTVSEACRNLGPGRKPPQGTTPMTKAIEVMRIGAQSAGARLEHRRFASPVLSSVWRTHR